jgi:hypothetical protein
MDIMNEDNDGTSRRDLIRSCFTTLLVIGTIGMTLGYIQWGDYASVGKLWFIALVIIYSVDQFIIKRFLWPIFGERRKKKAVQKWLGKTSDRH